MSNQPLENRPPLATANHTPLAYFLRKFKDCDSFISWSDDCLDKDKWIPLLVHSSAVNDALSENEPLTVQLNPACVAGIGQEQARLKAKRKAAELRELRDEIEEEIAEGYQEQLEELNAKVHRIYAEIDAKTDARLAAIRR